MKATWFDCDQCRELSHFVCVELGICLEDNIKTGTCMVVFQLQMQVANIALEFLPAHVERVM